MLYEDAVVVAVWTELGVWAIFLVLYVACVDVLVRKRPSTHPIHYLPLSTASLLFGLSTVHIAVQLRKLFEGTVLHVHTPGGPATYFRHINHWPAVVGNTVYATMLVIGDSVVIHRCFLIWGKRFKVIILPILLLLGTAGSAYTTIWLVTKLGPRGTVFDGSIAQCTRLTFFLSLATNIVTTSLVAYRIISTTRKVAGNIDVRPYIRGLAVIVESAAIYTSGLVVFSILYVMKSNAQYIVYCALCPIIGIVPTLIIVRVGLSLTCPSQLDLDQHPTTLSLPTYIVTPASSIAPTFPTLPTPSYPSSWSRSVHIRDTSGSDTTSPDRELDMIHLQLRYSQASTGHGVTSDDHSKRSSTSKTSDLKE